MTGWTVAAPQRLTPDGPVTGWTSTCSAAASAWWPPTARPGATSPGSAAVSGPVEALGVAGDLDMETVSGEVTLADGAAGQVRARTASGAITSDLDNTRGGDIRLSTTCGGITVRVREDSDLAVRLRTTAGRITSAFAQVRGSAAPGAVVDSEGALGAGAGRLWASAASGGIALPARPVGDEEGELP